MARYILMEPAFIGGALLAPGSIIVDEDLPIAPPINTVTGRVQVGEDGKPLDPVRSPPPESSIEVDDNGWPVNEGDVAVMANAGVSALPIEVAAVNPHAPFPTAPQGYPSRMPGEVFNPALYKPAAGSGGDPAPTQAHLDGGNEAAATEDGGTVKRRAS